MLHLEAASLGNRDGLTSEWLIQLLSDTKEIKKYQDRLFRARQEIISILRSRLKKVIFDTSLKDMFKQALNANEW